MADYEASVPVVDFDTEPARYRHWRLQVVGCSNVTLHRGLGSVLQLLQNF